MPVQVLVHLADDVDEQVERIRLIMAPLHDLDFELVRIWTYTLPKAMRGTTKEALCVQRHAPLPKHTLRILRRAAQRCFTSELSSIHVQLLLELT